VLSTGACSTVFSKKPQVRSDQQVVEIREKIVEIKYSIPDYLLVKCKGMIEGKPRTMEELAELTASNMELFKSCVARQHAIVDVIVDKKKGD
jgi:hypothetical protein